MDKYELNELQVSSEKVYDGRLLHVYKDKVKLPNEKITTREYIRHVGAVCIVAIDKDGSVIIEEQFRYPFDCVITELPAGKLDSLEEAPLDAAKREFREETGFSADSWTYLGVYYPSVAYTDEKIHMFLAQELHKGEQELDSDEFLSVHTRPFGELLNDVMENKIPDGKTQTAILKAARVLGL
jgi:ADP-ribose pyrophosphatase